MVRPHLEGSGCPRRPPRRRARSLGAVTSCSANSCAQARHPARRGANERTSVRLPSSPAQSGGFSRLVSSRQLWCPVWPPAASRCHRLQSDAAAPAHRPLQQDSSCRAPAAPACRAAPPAAGLRRRSRLWARTPAARATAPRGSHRAGRSIREHRRKERKSTTARRRSCCMRAPQRPTCPAAHAQHAHHPTALLRHPTRQRRPVLLAVIEVGTSSASPQSTCHGGMGKWRWWCAPCSSWRRTLRWCSFRSLRDAPECSALLDDCSRCCRPAAGCRAPEPGSDALELLLEELARSGCCWCSTTWKSCWKRAMCWGGCVPALKPMGTCCGRWPKQGTRVAAAGPAARNPPDCAGWRAARTLVRSLPLSGWMPRPARSCWPSTRSPAPKRSAPAWGRSRGNPLALKIVAETIADPFRARSTVSSLGHGGVWQHHPAARRAMGAAPRPWSRRCCPGWRLCASR